MSRLVVIMAGPLPPAVGGMASVIGALSASSLAQRVDLRLFQTGKTTPEGRTTWQGARARLQVIWDFWCLLSRQPRPLVHIHTCSGLTYFLDGILLTVAWLRGAPIVLHVHGARFDTFLDGLGPLQRAVARWLARQALAVVVLSDDWRKRLTSRLPGAHLHVIANGVPSVGERIVKAAVSAPQFLFLGNLGRRKGVHVLLAAAALTKSDWVVNLAGGEEDSGFTEWTRSEIKRLDLGARLRLLGPVVGDAKVTLLRSADGFVLPSLAEGLPMALLEAMAARLPVVVTAVGAMPEVVQDGEQGYLIPPEDAPALADALDRLSANPQLRQQMGESAYQTCERAYGVERMVDSLLKVYSQIPIRTTQ